MKKGLMLLSAGIDSPVAGHIMGKKAEIEALHLKSCEKHLEMVERLCIKAGIKKLHYTDHTKVLEQIKSKAREDYTCVLCKRAMIMIAEKAALMNGCEFIVTGDNLGQVASQTLDNMAVISSAAKMPVLRPLLCNDKNEIIKIAEKIGTFGISSEKCPSCQFVPRHPATAARIKEIEAEEEKIGMRKIADDAVREIKVKIISG